MPLTDIDSHLKRWVDARIIDFSTAERIRGYESTQAPQRQSNWMVVLAVAFGALMLGAGVLLFVAAHWDELSPTQRFLLVLTMVSGFHIAGGLLIDRLKPLGIALHAVGTIALGGGIFLAGQIFNLQEHWPGGIMSGPPEPSSAGSFSATQPRLRSPPCSSPDGSPANSTSASSTFEAMRPP